MPYLLADSFGGLGQQAMADEQNRRLAMANAMSNFQQGMASSRQGRQFQQQLALERERAQNEQQYRTGELGMRQAEINRQLEMDRQRNALGQGYLDVQKKVADWQTSQPSPTAQRRIDFDFNAAAQDASQGRFDDPDHVLSMYPTLTEPEANVMASRSNDARQQIQAQHDIATHAADTLNKWNFLTKQQKAAQEAVGSTHWWQGDAKADAAGKLKDVTSQLSQIGPVAARLQADKRISSLVNYDPDSDAYVPAIPTQPWMKSSSPATGTGGAPSTGTGQPKQPRQMPIPLPGGNAPDNATGAWGSPSPSQTQATGTNGYTPKHSPYVYNRVNELVGKGMNPMAAKAQALQEDSALSSP